jgi:hypothetical protein
VKKDASFPIILCVDNCALHVYAKVVAAMQKFCKLFGKKIFILPLSRHIFIEPDIARKNNARRFFVHYGFTTLILKIKIPLYLFPS